ncbi:aspartate aminotransferase family protein [Leucobacter luti]|uniref:Adenosylmethionine-8-amino-7-oxononanoate aminotransferase n=1 Tax=Leucobacter luti TaxID=340320 RepID=A0A4Q7TZP4_9MICO|nr:aspartate aminotransferase family protein [Leucobacter luti]MBL3699114.1 aspartate aminotransferase family protein [Leucobacter luti]RZT66616.1 adenosylmethionine-8-amino-7-oxononanoate aminotransferase [Leucobacter luti]
MTLHQDTAAPEQALSDAPTGLAEIAKRHLVMNFTPAGKYRDDDLPVFVRGEHCSVFDDTGRRFFDGLAGLFCVQLGYTHGAEVGDAVREQLAELPFQTTWSVAHPPAARLAQKIAELAPGDLNRVFFASGGSESNEAAIKLARQFHIDRGEGTRTKFIARRVAYHGTSYGAMSLNGMTDVRKMFEPLMHGVRHTHNTKRYRRPEGETPEQTTAFLLAELESLIVQEGADTIAAIIMEPLQNAGGSLTPPTPEYFPGVRALCDKYGILLIADEVITGYGRLGSWFGSTHYGFQPDMITFAKGIASAYMPLGGVIASDRIIETVLDGSLGMFNHALTYGGHPVACAAALKNLEIMERERVVENVAELTPYLGEQLAAVAAKHQRIVGDLRGDGFHRSFELVTDHAAKRWAETPVNASDFVGGHLNPALAAAGLLCRVAIDAEGNPLVQVSPPLVMTRADIDELAGLLDRAFTAATASAGL